MSDRRNLTLIAAALLMGLWLIMIVAGTGVLDQALLAALYAGQRPALTRSAEVVTFIGQWSAVVVISAAVAGWLVVRGERYRALLLLAVTLSGRALVEAQKAGFDRPRPTLEPHLVPAHGLSFPSAHSANTMMVFLAVALIAAAPPWRRTAVMLAVLMSLLVGLTRPMLGVHWPSDVVGGWSFGAAWVLAMLAAAERWAQRHQAAAKR